VPRDPMLLLRVGVHRETDVQPLCERRVVRGVSEVCVDVDSVSSASGLLERLRDVHRARPGRRVVAGVALGDALVPSEAVEEHLARDEWFVKAWCHHSCICRKVSETICISES